MKLIDCRKVTKDRFEVERGYQPMNSVFSVVEGGFTFTVGGETHEARAGDTVFFPVQVYFERKMHGRMTFYYARFSADEGETPPCGILRGENRERLSSDLVMMERLSTLPPPADELADHYLRDLFATLDYDRLTGAGTGDPAVRRARAFFAEAVGRPVSLSETARVCGVSVSSLSQKFRRELGCAPMAYLSSLRIARAKELLCERDLPISEVAAACGFESPYYFSNAFLKETGLRPKEYRRQYRV